MDAASNAWNGILAITGPDETRFKNAMNLFISKCFTSPDKRAPQVAVALCEHIEALKGGPYAVHWHADN